MTTSNKSRGTFNALQNLIITDINLNLVPALLGEAGIGKSSFIKGLAKQLNTQAFVLSVNTLAGREDLTGARLIKDDKTGKYMQVFFPHQSISEAISYASEHPDETPILFLDEFNRTTPDVTSAIFQLITERRIGSELLPDNLRLVVAGNDVGNVEAIDSASTSRLSPYSIAPDLTTFLKVTPNLNSFIEHTLQARPDLLLQVSDDSEIQLNSNGSQPDDEDDDIFGAEIAENFRQIATPRTWEYLSEVMNAYELKDIDVDQMSPDEIRNLTSLMTTQTSNTDDVTLMRAMIESKIGNNEAADVLYNRLEQVYDKAINTAIPINSMQSMNDTMPWKKIEDAQIFDTLTKLTHDKIDVPSKSVAKQHTTDTIVSILLSTDVVQSTKLGAVMSDITFHYADNDTTETVPVIDMVDNISHEGKQILAQAVADGSFPMNSQAVKMLLKNSEIGNLGYVIEQLENVFN